MDKSTIVGIVVAIGGIAGGLLIEGGKLAQVIQPTAAMIVLGGTIGAVMIQFPLPVVLKAAKKISAVFIEPHHDLKSLVAELVKYSGTFSDRFPTNDEIEAVDAKRDRDLNVRPRR